MIPVKQIAVKRIEQYKSCRDENGEQARTAMSGKPPHRSDDETRQKRHQSVEVLRTLFRVLTSAM